MVTPKLLLLTGPAADDVAQVLYNGTTVADSRQGASCEPWWDEVRDYWDAPHYIAGIPDSVAIEHGIRSLPGGEEWLVRLVLPAHRFCSFGGGQEYCAYNPLAKRWLCEYCRSKSTLPARLAILAPEPVPLLVERVRSWGGEMWHCRHDSAQSEKCTCRITAHVPGVGHDVRYQGYFATWPEAVRAALVQS